MKSCKSCEFCEDASYGEELMFKVRGNWACENCFIDFVKKNYKDQYEDDYHDLITIADDLGIEYRSAQSVSEDNYWDMIDYKIDDLKGCDF